MFDGPIRGKCTFISLFPFLLVFSGGEKDQNQKFQPPEGMLIARLRETERHRAPIPLLRIARTTGGPENVVLWVHIDEEGQVLEVRDFKTDPDWHFSRRPDALIEAVRKISYLPFLRNGVAAEAWVQDEVQVGTEAASPPRTAANLPNMQEPTDFSIELSRSTCYGTCPSYAVVVHGDGKIEFHGGNFVAIPGEHQARIAPDEADCLIDSARPACSNSRTSTSPA